MLIINCFTYWCIRVLGWVCYFDLKKQRSVLLSDRSSIVPNNTHLAQTLQISINQIKDMPPLRMK